jgi:hypothetical protein
MLHEEIQHVGNRLNIIIVTEYCNGGNLEDYLKK